MAKIKLQTASVVEPVSLQELRQHVRLITQDQERDTQLTDFENAARDWVERIGLRRALVNRTYDEYFDAFASPMRLRWSPVSSISQITYVDTDGDTQTVATSVYELGEDEPYATARLKYNQVWPTDVRLHPDAVIVRYVAGYGAGASDVPDPIRAAIKIMVADMHENPESFITGTIVAPFKHEGTVKNLLASYRIEGVA